MQNQESQGFMNVEFFFERGHATVNQESCDGCGICVEICPDGVLSIQEGKCVPEQGFFMGCLACNHCAMSCPKGSIVVTGRKAERDRLVDLPPHSLLPGGDQLEALLLTRRSIRYFKKQEVEKEKVDAIVRMCDLAPMGIPPSQVGVIVVHGSEKVRQFSDDAMVAFKKMSFIFKPWILPVMKLFMKKTDYLAMRHFVRPLIDTLLEKHRNGEDKFTYNAPLALLFHFGPFADQADAAIVATYAMLAAESLGLGNCMLGTAVALAHDKAFKEKYGIPKDNKTGVALIAGYPAVKFERAVHRSLASVTYH